MATVENSSQPVEPKPDTVPSAVISSLKALQEQLAAAQAEVRKDQERLKTDLATPNQPIVRDEPAWSDIIQKATETYNLNSTQQLTHAIAPELLAIDSSFAFVALKGDEQFEPHRVEHLLAEANDLLTRGLDYQEQWDDLAVKTFNVIVELKEFNELDEIHQDETNAGVYAIPALDSFAELMAQSALVDGHANEIILMKWILDTAFSVDAINNQSFNAQIIAWLSQYEHRDAQVNWNKILNSAAEHAKLAAGSEVFHTLITQSKLINAQLSAATGAMQAALERQIGLRTRNKWDNKDVEFKSRRTQVGRRLAKYKAKALTEDDGALNYPKRMRRIRQLFERDFRDALARIFAASEGLKQYYGYSAPFPTSLEALRNHKNHSLGQYFSDALLWVRDAISWLAKFAQFEQNYVLALSIRESVSDREWTNGLKSGAWIFEVPESLFEHQCHVRLRGISAAVLTKENGPNEIWRAILTAPVKSLTQHLSGFTVQLNQANLPPCRLGRIFPRASFQLPDTSGAYSWHNASPIGKWDLSLRPCSPRLADLKNVEDVHLDLYLAIRAAPK